MDAHKKVLLVGDSTLMAVTEAALSAYPEMEVRRIEDLSEGSFDCDAIIINHDLLDERILALARANPGVSIFSLNWDEETFSWMQVRKDITLDAEHLFASINQRQDLF